jgi:hypothetical protein
MWLKLSEKEKLIWRQKAKKLKQRGSKGLISTGKTKATAEKSTRKKASKSADPTQRKEKTTKLTHFESSIENYRPIDIAAHFSLIGESMIEIGKKFKEQEVIL